MPRQLLALSAAGMGAAFRRQEASPVEVVEASLAVAQDVGDHLHAIASIDAEVARDAARQSERRWRAGTPLGPFDGVPITFKDSFHVKGLPRWHGTAISTGALSKIDAAPVRRAREAGMVIVAKTTMPDYAMLMSGLSSQHGIIRNAWDPETNPGGSSAGAGPSVAAGVAPVAVGTDMAGSVRLPAALSGLASIKPTQGRIAYDPPGNYRSAGPMAKTVDDVEEMLCILGQCDEADHYALEGRYQRATGPFTSLSGKRIGVIRRIGFGGPVAADTAAAVESQVGRLADLGAEIVDIADFALTEPDYRALYWYMLHMGCADYFTQDAATRGRILPEIGRKMDEILQFSAVYAAQSARRLATATETLRAQLRPFHYILSPALPVSRFAATDLSPRPETEIMSQLGFACWFNQLGWPSGTVPVLQSGAGPCPVSVQISGQRFDDAGVLQVLRLLEGARGFDISYPIRGDTSMSKTPSAG